MNTKEWLDSLHESRKPLPILTFPIVEKLGVSVYKFTHDQQTQADGIVKMAELTDSAAAVTVMDLSVEAEAFGCEIQDSENEVSNVIGTLLSDEDEADELAVPEVGAARTGMFIAAAKQAKERIGNKPVLAGMIGPYSLAGRLMDVSEIMVNCLVEPDFVHKTLRKTTDFLKNYALAYKAAGLDGIIIAEPLSGLLSPALEEEFSQTYCREIVEAVQDDGFAVIYHNCGPNVTKMTESLASIGAAAYHFGDAVDLSEMLEKMPCDRIVLGNISPSGQFVGGTVESMTNETRKLLDKCGGYGNFVLSSGCDIPFTAKWDNINAFFRTAKDYYK